MRLDRRLIGASIGLLALTGLGLYLALAAPYLANFRAVISLRRQAAALARRAGWVKGYGAPFFPLAVETTNQAGVYEYALFGQFEAVEGETLFLLGRGGRRLGVRLDNPDGQPLPAFKVTVVGGKAYGGHFQPTSWADWAESGVLAAGDYLSLAWEESRSAAAILADGWEGMVVQAADLRRVIDLGPEPNLLNEAVWE